MGGSARDLRAPDDLEFGGRGAESAVRMGCQQRRVDCADRRATDDLRVQRSLAKVLALAGGQRFHHSDFQRAVGPSARKNQSLFLIDLRHD